MTKTIGHRNNLKILAISVTMIALSLFIGNANGQNKVEASGGRDYSTNSIISGGALTANELITKAKAKTPSDIQPILSAYGLTPAKYDRFKKTAKAGVAYKNGDIKVDGRVVATNAKSLGRHKNTYTMNKVINGKTYYESYSKNVFLSNSIPAMVMFNDKGEMEFAVLTSCANPITGKLNNPKYSCKSLAQHKINETTYDFTVKASASNGASIAYGIIEYGDGSKSGKISASDLTSGKRGFKHTYKKSGNYKAKLTIYVNVPGSQTYTISPAGSCIQTIKVEIITKKESSYSCDKLTLSLLKGTDDTFNYSVSYPTPKNAVLKQIKYDFGDGKSQTVNNTKDQVSHTYTENGSFKAVAYLTYQLSNNTTQVVTSSDCSALITIKPIYACTLLRASSLNDSNTNYRFSAEYTARRAKLISATFSLDNKSPIEVSPDNNGNIFYDYSFSDEQKHNISATLNFNTGSTSQFVKCSASIIATLPPICPIPGKESLSPDDPKCFTPCPTNPNVPVGDVLCSPVAPTTPELPTTGPGHVVAMFLTLGAFGGAAHYILKRRNQRLLNLASATISAENSDVLKSIIAKQTPTNEEASMAMQEFNRRHPKGSKRLAKSRLIQKVIKRK